MQKFCILTFLFLVVLYMNAPAKHGLKENFNDDQILKIDLLSAADFTLFPTVNVGYEKRLASYISVYGAIGIHLYNIETAKENTFRLFRDCGYKSHLELRYYLNAFRSKSGKPYKALSGVYIAPAIFYSFNKYNIEIEYAPTINSEWQVDEFRVSKTIFGGRLNFGVQKKVLKTFYIDVASGIGLQNSQCKNFDMEYDTELNYPGNSAIEPTIQIKQYNALEQYNGWSPTFNLSFRLGLPI